jgi:hypothetical protein
MGANAERMMASMGKRTGGGSGGAFIGFDEKDIKKEFERAFKELENLHDGVTTAQIRRIARKSLKPMVESYKSERSDKAGNKRDLKCTETAVFTLRLRKDN